MSDISATHEGTEKHDKEFSIVVNAQEFTVGDQNVSYEKVTTLAYPIPPAPETRYTVTYRNAEGPNHEGSLAPGRQVKVKKKGTIFNVKATSKS
ncbi:multiubiquitin domain-containing protein [Streptomyces hokutonensis]|uniref:multiubiquitin domain-containing protein n=1 Tax=Streptomyces hokutonensis TaxID=1306990 RepID=UPI00131A1DD5|nr:multiubiquitin domain-containing protein [Streptomyces hokutonensis]